MPCPECAAVQLVLDDVGSLVCTVCGTLADPAQAVLADSNVHPTTSSYAAPRTSRGWHLAQTKQDRDRKNTIAMNTFINAVLSRLNNPGLSPRAEAIFTQAMTRGKYRWGRKARLAAGASMVIALREARRSDSLCDIALFLDDSSVSLARAFRSVVSLLDFTLDATDPAVHLPILLAHLQSVMRPDTLSPPQLPPSLLSVLAPLSLQGAVRTATSLSQIILHNSPPLPVTSLPTPPTACALFILGLEAEARAPLPHLKELSRTLATRFAFAPGVVSSRYKILYDQIEEWIRHVPWLDQFVYKGKGRGASARSKIPKRGVVAKGIKDVVQFHQEIYLSRTQNQQKVNLDLDLDPGDSSTDDEGQRDDASMSMPKVASSSNEGGDPVTASPRPNKRRKMDDKGDATRSVYQTLRDPSSSGATTFGGDISLLTHMPTCSPEELLARMQRSPLTRLQLLAASRGGSTEQDIADQELFVDGELEGLFRNEQERETLLPLFQLNWSEEMSTKEAPPKQETAETKRGAKRVDMDALARLLGEDVDGDNPYAEDDKSDDIDAYQWGWDDYISEQQNTTKIASDWEPTPPDDDDDDDGKTFI